MFHSFNNKTYNSFVSFSANNVYCSFNSFTNSRLFNSLFMFSKNKILYRTISTADSGGLKRVEPFNSVIRLFFCNVGSSVFNTYVKAFSAIHHPFGNRNDLPVNAAKILVSFPLLFVTLSTRMVDAIRSNYTDITLPVYSWGLLDKFFIRVERPNLGNNPGLNGNILSFDDSTSFSDFLTSLFSDKFLYECLVNTDFSRLAVKSCIKDPSTGKSITTYQIDSDFKRHLLSIINEFSYVVYSYEFIVNVSLFYSDFSSKFKYPVITMTKRPARAVNKEVGLHNARNHKLQEVYIYHSSVDDRFNTHFHFNSFVVLAKLFSLTYYSSKTLAFGALTTYYGSGLPGNNEISLDITSIQIMDAIKTLLSAGVSFKDSEEKVRTPSVSNCFENPFGAVRQFSTSARSFNNFYPTDCVSIKIGTYYYRSPILSQGYGKASLADGSIVIFKIDSYASDP